MELTVGSYNIRNGVALDRASCWFRRRATLARVVRALDADVWGLQEAYGFQRGYLRRRALWGHAEFGIGRNPDGGGEGCPVYARDAVFRVVEASTRWFGETPEIPGSRLPDAGFPRVATMATVEHRESGQRFVVANTHLDEKSPDNRRASVDQLVDWLDPRLPTVVCGDFNSRPDEPPYRAMVAAGFSPSLGPDDGPTSNGFGDPDHAHHIDEVFVRGLDVVRCSVRRDAGFASDHWPILATLRLG